MTGKERDCSNYIGEISCENTSFEQNPLFKKLEAISCEVRKGAFEIILKAGSGHLGASSSSTELMVALYFGGILRYDKDNPRHPDRDRVLVRGHLGPLRYKIFSLLGWIEEQELEGYRDLGSRLQGHESMHEIPGVDITPSGSLGMILSYGVGSAFAAKIQGKEYRTFVFLGDGEKQEGNISEAARHAAHLKLNNLICILDNNKAQLGRRTNTVDGATKVSTVWEGYGWDVIEINNGNEIREVIDTLTHVILQDRDKPVLIVANTIKGKGIPGAEDNCCGYHTISSCDESKLLSAISDLEAKLEELQYSQADIRRIAKELAISKKIKENYNPDSNCIDFRPQIEPPAGEKNLVNGLVHYLNHLSKLFRDRETLRLYFMTADLIREDQIELCGLVPPIIYIDVGIREQHLLAMAHGISQSDASSRIIINYGDAFLYRGADQLNAIAQGRSPLVIVGDDGGLSGARNGSTHQSSGQPGMIINMPGIRFYEPADVRDLFNCLNRSIGNYHEPTYIRLHTRNTEELERSDNDLNNTTYYEVGTTTDEVDCVIISSGLTTQGVVEAKKLLKEQYGITARVINVVDLKSLDENFARLIKDDRPVLTVYNGNEVILRNVVSAALLKNGKIIPSSMQGHGFEYGTSGSLEDLIKHFKFDGEGIVEILKHKFPYLFDNPKVYPQS